VNRKFYSILILAAALLGLAFLVFGLETPEAWVTDRFRTQETRSDCGAACVRIVLAVYGRKISLEEARRRTKTTARGASMLDLKKALDSYGFHSEGWKFSPADLDSIPLPSIVFVYGHHFSVLDVVNERFVELVDPERGRVRMTRDRFFKAWDGHTLVIYSESTSYLESRPDRFLRGVENHG